MVWFPLSKCVESSCKLPRNGSEHMHKLCTHLITCTNGRSCLCAGFTVRNSGLIIIVAKWINCPRCQLSHKKERTTCTYRFVFHNADSLVCQGHSIHISDNIERRLSLTCFCRSVSWWWPSSLTDRIINTTTNRYPVLTDCENARILMILSFFFLQCLSHAVLEQVHTKPSRPCCLHLSWNLMVKDG